MLSFVMIMTPHAYREYDRQRPDHPTEISRLIEHCRALEEVLLDLILLLDRERVIRYANQAAARLLKRDARIMTGKYFELFFPARDYSEQYQQVQHVLRSGEAGTSTGLVRFPAAELFVNTLWVPVRELSGIVSGVVIISRDISELRPPSLQEQKSEDEVPVSGREQQVLNLIAEGKTNKEIGQMLFISPKTVDVHRSNIMKKLDAHNTAELILRSRKTGLLY